MLNIGCKLQLKCFVQVNGLMLQGLLGSGLILRATWLHRLQGTKCLSIE